VVPIETIFMTLKTGMLSYYESFQCGLLPCCVTGISGRSGMPSTTQRVTVKLTADRSPFKRGDVIETFGFHVIPRKSVHKRGYHYVIWAYTVEVAPNNL